MVGRMFFLKLVDVLLSDCVFVARLVCSCAQVAYQVIGSSCVQWRTVRRCGGAKACHGGLSISGQNPLGFAIIASGAVLVGCYRQSDWRADG
jgi:hypothetical protein